MPGRLKLNPTFPTRWVAGPLVLVLLAGTPIEAQSQATADAEEQRSRIARNELEDAAGTWSDEPGSTKADAAPVDRPSPPSSQTPSVPASRPSPVLSRAFGVRAEAEPPGYVRPISESGIPGLRSLDWLDFGLEQVTRFEYRSDLRRPDRSDDHQFLMRSRVYIGVRKILDPLRFVIEFQDARQFQGEWAPRTRDVDEADFLQAFAELHFDDMFGPEHLLEFRAGRMTLEYGDRRLVGRNRWRNTTNAFDGFRVRLGQERADWQVDVFAVRPVEIRMLCPDHPDEERWFYGIWGAWRKWSKIVSLEPYYYMLDEDWKDRAKTDREIHTIGLRAFGLIGETGFDYDLNAAFQFGEDGDRGHRAFAAAGALGYTFDHAWKPRLELSSMYASGDGNPDDGASERFDRLFQVTHCPSMTDLFCWSNIINAKLRLGLTPTEKLGIDGGYGVWWLASDTDAWVVPGLRDPDGASGSFIGHDLEVRMRCRLDRRIEIESGYVHLIPGGFTQRFSPPGDGDFFYVQTTLRF